jgi:hypothetical protein
LNREIHSASIFRVNQALGLQLSGFYFLRSEIGQQFLRSRVGKSAQEEGRSRTKCLCAFSELR